MENKIIEFYKNYVNFTEIPKREYSKKEIYHDSSLAMIDFVKLHMKQLFQEIKHGDQEHQDWLENKIEEYLKNNL